MTTTHFYTAADLETMSRDTRYELYEGVLYEVSPSSIDSSAIAMRIGILLGEFVYRFGLGIVSGESGGYRVERDPDTVIAPDVGFVRSERLALWPGHRGFFPGVPDLAIEVISPTDEPADIERKRTLYSRVRVPLIWWINPVGQTVIVQRSGKEIVQLTIDDTLDGDDVVPGFSLPLANIFDFR